MKKLKIIVFLCLIFLLSGCSGNYDITINNDLSINEELNLELTNTGSEYNKTVNIFKENNIDQDNYHISVNGSKVIIKYQDKFNSIDDYVLNSKIYHQLIDEIKYSKVDNYIDIYINQNLKLKQDGINVGNTSDLDAIKININNPLKVIVSNEDELNGDTYTWNITKDTINKKILLQFEPKLNKISYRVLVPAIVLTICIIILATIIVRNYRNANKF